MNENGQQLSKKHQDVRHRTVAAPFSSSSTRIRDFELVKRQQNRKNILLALCVGVLVYLYVEKLAFLRLAQRTYSWLRLHEDYDIDWDAVSSVVTRPQDISNDSRALGETPQYVLDYAPLVHLYSEENFWPCDIAEHLLHLTPELDYTPIQAPSQLMNLTNLNHLNDYDDGRHVYLTSVDNVEERPDWLGGEKNIPDDFGEEGPSRKVGFWPMRKTVPSTSYGGRSDAPAVLITLDKGHGVVDAFWFYFYSYNLGNKVLNVRFGNHVGDWEHSLIRFHHGKPKLVFFSEHNFGDAYTYKAVEKIGKRVSSNLPLTSWMPIIDML